MRLFIQIALTLYLLGPKTYADSSESNVLDRGLNLLRTQGSEKGTKKNFQFFYKVQKGDTLSEILYSLGIGRLHGKKKTIAFYRKHYSNFSFRKGSKIYPGDILPIEPNHINFLCNIKLGPKGKINIIKRIKTRKEFNDFAVNEAIKCDLVTKLLLLKSLKNKDKKTDLPPKKYVFNKNLYSNLRSYIHKKYYDLDYQLNLRGYTHWSSVSVQEKKKDDSLSGPAYWIGGDLDYSFQDIQFGPFECSSLFTQFGLGQEFQQKDSLYSQPKTILPELSFHFLEHYRGHFQFGAGVNYKKKLLFNQNGIRSINLIGLGPIMRYKSRAQNKLGLQVHTQINFYNNKVNEQYSISRAYDLSIRIKLTGPFQRYQNLSFGLKYDYSSIKSALGKNLKFDIGPIIEYTL